MRFKTNQECLPFLFFQFPHSLLWSTDRKQTRPFSHTLDWHTQCKPGMSEQSLLGCSSHPKLSRLTSCPEENMH